MSPAHRRGCRNRSSLMHVILKIRLIGIRVPFLTPTVLMGTPKTLRTAREAGSDLVGWFFR